ncbi:hypothetical protein A3J41_00830 [candidate division TM6 bacterium RIFCSPHIGHO2_12_FULL_38_8]|nr:MAG: hypothetical protein A3J41_00830 [candidate division TM6 bacterium RIFCSPHIGHO2_12_FULL_38_8]
MNKKLILSLLITATSAMFASQANTPRQGALTPKPVNTTPVQTPRPAPLCHDTPSKRSDQSSATEASLGDVKLRSRILRIFDFKTAQEIISYQHFDKDETLGETLSNLLNGNVELVTHDGKVIDAWQPSSKFTKLYLRPRKPTIKEDELYLVPKFSDPVTFIFE